MNKLDILDRLFDGLKFKDAMYSEKTNTCIMNFLYNPDIFSLTDDLKDIMLKKVKELVGDYVKYDFKFVSCPLDKHSIANYTYSTIVNNFPALSKDFTFDDVAVNIEGMTVNVKLKLSPTIYDFAKTLGREETVANRLKDSFFADFVVEFEKKSMSQKDENLIEKNMELLSSIKVADEKTVYELTDVTDIFGKTTDALAMDFSKINSTIENVTICGNVMNVKKKTYTKTYTKNNETKEISRQFLSFALKNGSSVMYCSFFPRQAEEAKLDIIEDGMTVCSTGSTKEYNGKINFTCSTISKCKFNKEEAKFVYKPVNKDYHTVFPQKYFDYEQSDLFAEDEKSFDGSYVVFDLETTGLEASKDEIIEIGACKIVNGRIDETFSSFVKPKRRIPKEITALTGITDAMVKDAPSINYVMPDFYKFCYGSTMVGHNVSFDIGFIYAQSKKLLYNFDNLTMDTMQMAHNKLPGLKNYKLGTVVEKLKIALDNAHRAINDATATAIVFIKLF